MAHGELRVLVFGASLREGSLNVALAELAARAAEGAGVIVDRASLRDFDAPSYDGDEEGAGRIPAGIHELRKRIEANDAFIIASPEYNGSMCGALKNVVDWTSRFRSSWIPAGIRPAPSSSQS